MVGFTCWRIAVKARWFPSLPVSSNRQDGEGERYSKKLRGEPVGGWDAVLRFLRGCAEIPSDGLFQYNAMLVRHLVEQQERISQSGTHENNQGHEVALFVPPRALMYSLSAYAKAAWRFPQDVTALTTPMRDATPFALEMAIIATLKHVHVLMLPALRQGSGGEQQLRSHDVDEDTVLVGKSVEGKSIYEGVVGTILFCFSFALFLFWGN
jgi:hypothetical protein